MALNYIKCNLRQIVNKDGQVERVTLISVESDMKGYNGVTDPMAQINELPYILHALSLTDIKTVGQTGFPYAFPISF